MAVIPIGAACGVGTESCNITVTSLGRNNDTVLFVGTEALYIHLNLSRGEGDTLSRLDVPVQLYVLTFEGDKLHSVIGVFTARTRCYCCISGSVFERSN